ncbi:DUF3710 domain-containing protein [Boudabousia marimammalium]|uniref:DUF3710 domain-containing protein n=1 Tax=Boudabousia marimammalium TaxID=156892 RepID=A0A1Q5PR46_9ACTO|nr:DUF3710 domain-containing protein [Boudabousia marimammalium]OKL49949.1 hypothetical protein BM477_03325 [Boudabousia marimammalium]
MGIFSRKRRGNRESADLSSSQLDSVDLATGKDPEDSQITADDDSIVLSPRSSDAGPLDAESLSELPTDGYADLGIVRFHPVSGMQMNMPQNQEPYSPLTFIIANAALQVTVFACPKGEDGRLKRYEDITQAYEGSDSTVTQVETRYGTELHVSTPVTAPDGRAGVGVVRILLVGGHRWVAQLVIHGAAVDLDSAAAKLIDDFIDSLIIVRGSNPAAPYSILLPQNPAEFQQV